MAHMKAGGCDMSNLIKKLFLLLLLIFSPTFLFAAPNITINNPSSDVSTENAVLFDVSINDSLPIYGFVDWDDSLVGWWRAEDNTNDESHHANHGTFSGDAHIVDTGKYGKAFSFDGVGDSVNIGDKDAFDFHKTDSFTISVWVNKADDSEGGILSKGRGFTLFYAGIHRWQFTLDGHYIYADEPNPQGKWIHVAVVYDASNPSVSMYIDGEHKAGGGTAEFGDFSSASHLGIGKGRYPGVEHNGLIDEVIIFKRALAADEIKALYGVTNNRFINTFDNLTEFTAFSYQLYAINSNGEKSNTDTRSILIDVPNTPPRVILHYPHDNSRSSSTEQTFKCTVFDTNRNTELKSVTFYWDYPGSFTAAETIRVSGDVASVEFTKTGLSGKTFQWNCYARDTGNNSGFAPENYTFTVGRDVYYVATNGNDANPGTLAKPFRTIQRAADIAFSGDTIYIRSGVYRETVTPNNSRVSFKAYPGEVATISGADIIAGPWTLDKGSIYKTTMNWDMGKGNNQIFVDGEALIEARWPNTDDISRPKHFAIDNGSYEGQTAIIHSANVVQAPGFWDGAIVHAIWGARYHAITGEVRSSSPGTLELDLHCGPDWDITYGIFYITCSYNALDKLGEWFYDSSDSTLYLWAPSNPNPSTHTVEAKRRNVAFNLNGMSYITIEGLNIFSANITTDNDSHHILIDNCAMKYISHYTIIDEGTMGTGSKGVRDSGIILDGHDNILKNSNIAYSAGNGVALIGDNNTVHNCTIHDINYVVTDCGAVHTGSQKTENNKITYNKLYNAGRSLILHSNAQNLKILHNEMYYSRYGWESWDLGATYAIATDGKGTEIAYNYIHDARSIGIYIDNYNLNFLIHHNVIDKTWSGRGYFIGLHFDSPGTNNQVYNNTILSQLSIRVRTPPSGFIVKNNIAGSIYFRNGSRPPAPEEVDYTNNIELNTIDPTTVFVDFDNKNFRLKPDSPAIDAGVDVGFTHDIVGNPIVNAPDIGAYEYVLFPVSVIQNEPKEGRVPLTVSFDGSQSSSPNGNIVSYEWDFGDGSTSTGVKTSHIFTSPGEYTVTLTVTDVYGLKDESQTHITVFEKEFRELPAGCYNNVFNPAKGEKALIVVEVPKQAHVRLNLYNTRGNKIKELADEEREAGRHKYYWDGKSGNGDVVGSGLYFVHIQAGDYKKTKKIVVVK